MSEYNSNAINTKEVCTEVIDVFRRYGLTFEQAYNTLKEIEGALEHLKNKAKIN